MRSAHLILSKKIRGGCLATGLVTEQLPNRVQIREVVLGGIPYRVKSNLAEEELKKLVGFVDDKIQTALMGTKSGSYQNAAILACLNIAEELFHQKKSTAKHLDQMESTVLQILSQLNEA